MFTKHAVIIVVCGLYRTYARSRKVEEERIRLESRRRASRKTKVAATISRRRDGIRNKEHLVPRVAASFVRGSTFPGRRVSTHRHTCLRKVSSAYAAVSFQVPCSLFGSLALQTCFSADRESSRRHGPNLPTLFREGKLQRCEGTLRTQLKHTIVLRHAGYISRLQDFYISFVKII